jgi:putative ABC transport system permease protein
VIRESARTVRLGLKSLLLHKLRSSLTTAGILFGVASVIAMLAVGEGASHDALMRFRDMGVTNILVRSVKPPETGDSGSGSIWTALAYGLTYKEADRIEATLQSTLPKTQVVRVREIQRNVTRGPYFKNTVVVGTVPGFLGVVNMRIDEGRWLSDTDMVHQTNYCVLGASLARALFPLENPMGQTVLVGADDRFQVVGILQYQGRAAGPQGTTLDECVFVAMTSSRRRFGDEVFTRMGGATKNERVELHEVKVKVETSEEVESAAAVLRDMILPAHEKQNDIEITVPLELLRQEEASKRMFNIVLAVIASISLLVGGIGIMNVMLATVTERTREIGIRRALGAKRKNIIAQFLVEAAVLSALGGLVGVALGMIVPYAIESWFKQTTIIMVPHVMLALGISAAVGVVFGIYPAWRAANMDPVEALRHE